MEFFCRLFINPDRYRAKASGARQKIAAHLYPEISHPFAARNRQIRSDN
jgi:hypothetical protein